MDGPTPRFWNIVAGVEIPHIDGISAPSRRAFAFKLFPKVAEPDLFANGFWDRSFSGLFRLRDDSDRHRTVLKGCCGS